MLLSALSCGLQWPQGACNAPPRGCHHRLDLGLLPAKLLPGYWVIIVKQAYPGASLMLQVCLAAVMAQVGAWVPAESLTLSPVDAAFVRMGAKVIFPARRAVLCSSQCRLSQKSNAKAAVCGVSLHRAIVSLVAWELEQHVSNRASMLLSCPLWSS